MSQPIIVKRLQAQPSPKTSVADAESVIDHEISKMEKSILKVEQKLEDKI